MSQLRMLMAASFAGLLAGIVQVQATDIESLPEAHDWSGFYIGVLGGYSWSDFKVDNVLPDEDEFDRNQTFSVDDGLLGGEIGWNIQSGSIVYGVAADIAYSWAEDDTPEDTENGDEIFVGEHEYFATLRGKLGYAFDNVLVYATGGLALTDAEFRYENYTSDPPIELEERSSSSDTLLGWAIGGGLELAVTEHISVKAEYLYADFGSLDYSFLDSSENLFGEVDIDTHMLRGGILFSL
jgi:outer membrane immunogenic protein